MDRKTLCFHLSFAFFQFMIRNAAYLIFPKFLRLTLYLLLPILIKSLYIAIKTRVFCEGKEFWLYL